MYITVKNDKYNILKNDEELLLLKEKIQKIDEKIEKGILKEETEKQVSKRYPELF